MQIYTKLCKNYEKISEKYANLDKITQNDTKEHIIRQNNTK